MLHSIRSRILIALLLPCLALVPTTACTQAVVRSNHEGFEVVMI